MTVAAQGKQSVKQSSFVQYFLMFSVMRGRTVFNKARTVGSMYSRETEQKK